MVRLAALPWNLHRNAKFQQAAWCASRHCHGIYTEMPKKFAQKIMNKLKIML
jgi:hypothetical protein